MKTSSYSWIILLIISAYQIISGLALVSTYPWSWYSINIHGYSIISGILNIAVVYGLLVNRRLGLNLIIVGVVINLINRFLIYEFAPMFSVDVLYSLLILYNVYREYQHLQELDIHL